MKLQKYYQFRKELNRIKSEMTKEDFFNYLKSLDPSPIKILENIQDISNEWVDIGYNILINLAMHKNNDDGSNEKEFDLFEGITNSDNLERKMKNPLDRKGSFDNFVDTIVSPERSFVYNIYFYDNQYKNKIDKDFIIPFFKRMVDEYEIRFIFMEDSEYQGIKSFKDLTNNLNPNENEVLIGFEVIK